MRKKGASGKRLGIVKIPYSSKVRKQIKIEKIQQEEKNKKSQTIVV